VNKNEGVVGVVVLNERNAGRASEEEASYISIPSYISKTRIKRSFTARFLAATGRLTIPEIVLSDMRTGSRRRHE
jgi:hypothetical protein